MGKKCICELCNCGRHRCPHRPHALLGDPDKACWKTLYNTNFLNKPIEVRQSFKPPNRAVDSDIPLEDKTTNRMDYVKHPVHIPYRWNPDPYKKPPGNHDMLTSYTKDYPEKQVEPAKAIRHDTGPQIPCKFDTEPTYRADYRNWKAGMPKRYGPEAIWKPPSDKFASQSTMRHDYRGQCQPPPKALVPDCKPLLAGPFDDKTYYRQEFVPHKVQPRVPREPGGYKPPDVPLDTLTTQRQDYRGQRGQIPPSCKPPPSVPQSDVPMQGQSTARADYIHWPTPKPKRHQPDPYCKPQGHMDLKTTSGVTYIPHALQQHVLVRPHVQPTDQGKFDAHTNYRVEFQPYLVKPPQPCLPPEYKPNDAPFLGQSTQRASYVAPPVVVTQSCKPPYTSVTKGPFDDGTMYRTEYSDKSRVPCPAARLDHTGAAFTFVEVDSKGHRLYQPMVYGEQAGNSAPIMPSQLPPLAVA